MAAELALGTRIARRRQVLGMTQQDLAAALGVSKSTVANWETGKHFPRRYLGKVEAVLGVRLDSRPEYNPVSDELRRLIAETLPGDPERQRRVIGLLEGTMSWPGTNGAQAEERSAR